MPLIFSSTQPRQWLILSSAEDEQWHISQRGQCGDI
jgi:hypothetical protein